jgi:hypothetical protein
MAILGARQPGRPKMMLPASALQISLVFPGVTLGNLSYILFRNSLGVPQIGVDGKFRTNEAAEAAVHTFRILAADLGRMITLGIKALTLFEATIGAEFDAEATAFAPIFNNVNHALGDGMSL